MTRATERTDSEIHSFFHWAIMTRGHWEDRQWDTFILPLSYHNPGHREDRPRDTFILSLSFHEWSHGDKKCSNHSYSFLIKPFACRPVSPVNTHAVPASTMTTVLPTLTKYVSKPYLLVKFLCSHHILISYHHIISCRIVSYRIIS